MDERSDERVQAAGLGAVTALVGRERAIALLGRLAEQIDRGVSAEALLTARPENLRRDAHALASSAGTLGFGDLARLCRELEAACLAGPPPGRLLARVSDAGGDAIAAIGRLRAA